MSFFWNIFQSQQIDHANSKAENANIKINQSKRDIRHLEDKIDALAVVTHALWELLEENTTLSKNDIEKKIEEIDLRDGKLDRKLSSNITHCEECGHKLNKRHSNCFWCGAAINKPII